MDLASLAPTTANNAILPDPISAIRECATQDSLELELMFAQCVFPAVLLVVPPTSASASAASQEPISTPTTFARSAPQGA